MKKFKYQLSINILEKSLISELKDLELYKKSGDRWGLVNIEPCEHRIQELKNSLTELKQHFIEK